MRTLPQRLYYGWIVLAAVSGLNFANGATAIGVLTVFILPLTEEFGWTRTQISVVTSVGAILGALIAPVMGRVTDTWGARLPLTLGSICIVLATWYLAVMQSLLGFYVAFSLARVADQGCVQACSSAAIAKWFQRYRGRAMSVLFLAASAGGVLLPLLVHSIIQAWHWRTAWGILSGIMLGFGVLPSALLLRRQPEDVGLSVDGEALPRQTTSALPPSVEACPSAGAHAIDAWSLREALRTPTLWLLLAAAFVVGVGSTGVGLHVVPYLHQQGVAPTAAVGMVSGSFLASGVSNLLWGFSADRLAVRPLLVVMYALRAASLGVLLIADTIPKASLFALVQGFADGGIRPLAAVLLANYYGRQHLGAIYGFERAVQVLGFALGPLVSGATFDHTQSYHDAFVAFLVLSSIGTLCVACARQPQQTLSRSSCT
jgi:MFS transporter, OFA family, oxalate/formate antiporter